MKKLSTLWRLLLPVLFLLAITAIVMLSQQISQQLTDIELDAKNQASSIAGLVHATDAIVSAQIDSAVQLLKTRPVSPAAAGLEHTATRSQTALPSLTLGAESTISSTALPDHLPELAGGSATLLVKSGDAFYRASDNLQQTDGSHAIGGRVELDETVNATLNKGLSFQELINVDGQLHLGRYESIRDDKGAIVAIWQVKHAIDLQAIRTSVEHARYLSSGFVLVLDNRNEPVFHSDHASSSVIREVLGAPGHLPNKNWKIVKEKINPWHLKVLVAYPLSEAYKVVFFNSLLLISQIALLGMLLFLAIRWQLKRLVLDPIGSDPALAIDAVHKMTEGHLEHNTLSAQSGTLMANVLSMPEELQKTLQALKKNAVDLRLSASVFEHVHDGIFITNTETLIVEVNPAFTQITGYTREEAIGKSPVELNFACNEQHFFEHLWQNTASAGDWKGECHNERKSGEIYIASLNLFVVRDNNHQISHYVGVFSDITADMAHRENLEHMAYHDPLTQLPNRTLLADRLQQALSYALRMNEMLAVCYFDLDDFKKVNDQHGHVAGDNLLIQFANRMRRCLRESDTIARMGGDEFALLLCGLGSMEECNLALKRLLAAVNMPFTLGETSASVSASIGYTVFPLDNSTPDTLLRHADNAMYQAKLNGGGCYHLFDAEHDRFTRGQRQERERIESALPANEFCLYYQPKVDMQSGQVVGVEALLRWQHPELGLRSPNEFLPQIENTDFIIKLGEWVILQALKQMEAWQKIGLNIPVSINIAARHLMQPDFANRLAQLLDSYPDVSPGRLELEITETAVIEDISGATQIMHSCKLLGVSFALDDFGVGYSSLTYLRRLPIDIIKIDQSFIRDMLHDYDDRALITGIISLSNAFNRSLVAEGLETPEQGAKLLAMGCNVAQGNGIARPLAADQVAPWVAAYQPDEHWKPSNWQPINPRH